MQKPLLGQQIEWANPLLEGLVCYLLMNEGAGGTVFDLSGNGNDGTLESGVLWMPGKFGSALKFGGDGSGDYVTVSYDDTLNITQKLTVSVWVYAYVLPGTYDWIIQLNEPDGYGFFISGGTNFRCAVGGSYQPSIGTIIVNKWYHLVMTVEPEGAGVRTKIYINGVYKTTATANNMNANGEDLYIGRSDNTTRNEWNGLIDNLMIFNRTLSASEIAQLHREIFARFLTKFRISLFAATIIGVTISPDAAVASCAVVDPTVVRGNITISPSPVEATIATIPPTVIKESVIISPAPASAEAVGVDPIIPISADVIVTPAPVIAKTKTLHASFEEWTSKGKPFLYTAANWENISFYLEVYIRATSGTAGARFYNDTDSIVVDNSTVQTTKTTFQRLRTDSLVLVDGKVYRVQFGTPAIGNGEAWGASLIAA